jgi:hypothetical protein
MSGHAKLSPSGAYRYLACPGSVREEAKYPEQPSGPGAVDGTHSHTLLEHCLKAFIDPLAMIGLGLTDHEGDFVVDKERAARVKVAFDYVHKVDNLGLKVLTESRVSPAHLIGRTDMDGTVDIQIHGPEVLEIADYKDGMNLVEAKDNPQLELYALGVLAGLGLPVNGVYPFKSVKMTIIQPKLAVKGLPVITSHVMTVPEVLALIPKYVVGGAATEKPDAPLIPGEKQCKYCRASGCSARGQAAMAAAGVAFPVLTAQKDTYLPSTAASTQVAEQDPGTMTNERLCEILEAAPLMRQMIEQAEAEAQRRMESGVTIPGLKLVNGRGSQVWNLDEEQIAEKLKGMGVPKDAIWVTKLVSPAQAKKLSWVKRDGTAKQLTERQLKTLETEYISKLGGKLTVAPASDPRPAVVRDAAPLFSAVVEPQAPALPSWLS